MLSPPKKEKKKGFNWGLKSLLQLHVNMAMMTNSHEHLQ